MKEYQYHIILVALLSLGCGGGEEAEKSDSQCMYSSDCQAGSVCLDGSCTPTGESCTDGELYCSCLPDLQCQAGLKCFEETLVCIEDECPDGTLGCECAQGNTGCEGELVCVDAICSPAPGSACSEICMYSADGECDDGGPGSVTDLCSLGTDCIDCGPR
jgi:hypothetical protein